MFRNKDYILAVYREGGFSKAAEKLYISQPSLSASVKRIEDKIGAPVFDRSTAPISLTEAGREYVKYAMEIEEKEKSFEQYMADYTKLLTGTIRVGGSSLFSSFMLPRMVSRFQKKHPQIKFEIVEDSTKNLLQRLSSGSLDIVIDNTVIESKDITTIPYTSEILLLAVPQAFAVNRDLKAFGLSTADIRANRHLSDMYCTELTRFEAYPFICLNAENDTGKRARLLFKKNGMTPEIIFSLDQQVTAYNISSTGMGISFISDTLIKHMESESALCYYRLNEPETIRNIYFYSKTNRYLSRACREFIHASLSG